MVERTRILILRFVAGLLPVLAVIAPCMLLTLSGCANRGVGPQGGPKDSIPPTMVREEPLNGTVNFRGKQVNIYFNEYLQLSNVAENVLISPPMPHQPEVKANGKHIQVSFQDTLLANTTYTIDFGNAICDYHEKNPILGYSFAFSTGPHIDTLEAYGQVLYAENLNPVFGAVVGIQECLDDSAFSTRQFTRIAKSDSSGYFAIRNIREGDYRYYALMDNDKSYTYQPGEPLGFTDEVIHPFLYNETRLDTVWENRYDTVWVQAHTSPVSKRDTINTDSVTADTEDTDSEAADTDSVIADAFITTEGIISSETTLPDSILRIDTTRYIAHIDTFIDTYAEPGNLVLLLFSEDKQRHYMLRATRDERHRIVLPFSAPQDSMPVLQADWIDRALVEASRKMDSVVIWLRDSDQIMNDSLELTITYLKSDSVYNLVPQTDTLTLMYRQPRMSEKALEAKARKDAERRLVAKANASATFQVFDTLRITFDYPVDSLDTAKIALYEKKDTVFIRRMAEIVPTVGSSRRFDVLAKLEPEHMYELRIDSAAATDIYGKCCLASKAAVTVKSLSVYSTIRVNVPHAGEAVDPAGSPCPIVVQLLDEKDNVVRSLPLVPSETLKHTETSGSKDPSETSSLAHSEADGERVPRSGGKGAVPSVFFQYLELKACYLRLFIDWDGDGRWTTGDWAKHRQPEPVYYFPKKLSLKANWDFEETFDHTAVPQLESKPSALVKLHQFKKKK